MNNQLKAFAIFITLAALLLPHSAHAQEVPMKASGTNAQYFPFGDGNQNAPGDYGGFGKGTHLGKHLVAGNVTADGTIFPAPNIFFAGTFFGSQSLFAANGDRLDIELLEGDVLLDFDVETDLASGTWSTIGVITGGTGRFDKASGVVDIVAINPPFDPFSTIAWPFDWFIDGTIDLGKKNKKE
jgi:hypothetical protein